MLRTLAPLVLLLLVIVPGSMAQSDDQNATAPAPREPLFPRIVEDRYDPVPAWLDSDVAMFVASAVAWAVAALLLILVGAPLAKWAASKTPTDLDVKIVRIISWPAFLMMFTFGVADSVRIFTLPSELFGTLDHIWRIVFVVLWTIVIYRIWTEVLLDLGESFSKRTETQLDDKLYPLFSKIGGIVIVIGGIWFVVDSFGINMTLFAAGGALGGLVIAFAAQDTLSNFFAGIHILLDQPFREGDRIEIREEKTWGDVVDIGLRSTRIVTRDNRMVIVPNAVIGQSLVINHSFPSRQYRITTSVGVAYGTDVEKARTVLQDATRSVAGVEQGQPVQALFRRFEDSSLGFDVRYWIQSYLDTREIEDRVNTAINHALAREGIVIPFPQRVLWNGAQPGAPVA